MAASLERRVAIEAARAAGEILMSRFRATHRVAFKGQTTNLVTEMDERAEELIVGRLTAEFPDDAILAEERGAARGRSGRRWIVDPLDGTTNYAHGLPIFAVSIALEVDARIALGVAYDPSADELYVAERGRGATVNDAPLAVSATATLDAGLLSTGFPYNIRETRDTNLTEYATFALRCRGVRRLGSAVLDLAWVAAGRLDGFMGAPPGTVGRRRGRTLRGRGRRAYHEPGGRLGRRGLARGGREQRPHPRRDARRAARGAIGPRRRCRPGLRVAQLVGDAGTDLETAQWTREAMQRDLHRRP